MNVEIENPSLKEPIKVDSAFKTLIVDYVGKKLQPKNDEVTLEMVVGVMASEFKELVLLLAEENWIRGYHQAMEDMSEGEKVYHEKLQEAVKIEENVT